MVSVQIRMDYESGFNMIKAKAGEIEQRLQANQNNKYPLVADGELKLINAIMKVNRYLFYYCFPICLFPFFSF